MAKQNAPKKQAADWPAHGWLGLGLVMVFWILNWSLSGLRTHWSFFPLWLGYFSRVDDLPNLLNEQVQDPIPAHHRRRFAGEFWYKADGQAGERVVEFVADYVQDWGTSKRVYTICTAPPRRFKKKLTSTVKHVWRSLR